MKILRSKRSRRLALPWLLGVSLLLSAFQLRSWEDLQSQRFNAGLAAYQAGSMVEAVQFFDSSLSVYRMRESGDGAWVDHVYPAADTALAARASFQKAKALLALEQPNAALAAYRESLLLNPGNAYTNIALDQVARLEREARFTQYDLELLFQENEELAKKEGGRGEQNQPGNLESPGSEPGTQPGKGDPNSI